MKNRGNNRLSPEFVLLGFLYQSPSHGYELHHRLLDVFGNLWHSSQSQTYNILKRLENQGYIHSTCIEQEKLPARQLLRISGSGLERFETWLALPTRSSVHAIRVEFITRLYFTQLYFPARTQAMIQTQAEMVRTDLSQLKQQLEKYPDKQAINRMALELRIELLSSVTHWLDSCREAIQATPVNGQENE